MYNSFCSIIFIMFMLDLKWHALFEVYWCHWWNYISVNVLHMLLSMCLHLDKKCHRKKWLMLYNVMAFILKLNKDDWKENSGSLLASKIICNTWLYSLPMDVLVYSQTAVDTSHRLVFPPSLCRTTSPKNVPSSIKVTRAYVWRMWGIFYRFALPPCQRSLYIGGIMNGGWPVNHGSISALQSWWRMLPHEILHIPGMSFRCAVSLCGLLQPHWLTVLSSTFGTPFTHCTVPAIAKLHCHQPPEYPQWQRFNIMPLLHISLTIYHSMSSGNLRLYPRAHCHL